MKAKYEFTVKINTHIMVEDFTEMEDLAQVSEEVLHYVCDRMVEYGIITSFEFVERKMEASINE